MKTKDFCPIAVVSKVRPGGQMRPHDIFYVALSFIPKLYYKWPTSTVKQEYFKVYIVRIPLSLLSHSEGVKERIFYCILLPCTSGNVSYLCFVQGTHLTKDYLH